MVVRERRNEAAHVVELALEHGLLVLVPAGHAFREVPGLRAQQLDGVMALWRPLRIHERGRGHEQPRHPLVVGPAVAHRAPQCKHLLRPAHRAGRDGGPRAVWRLEFRGGVGRQVAGHAGHPDVVGVDAVDELLAPCFSRRHLHEVLDVNRREHGAPGHVALAVVCLDAGAAPVLEHQAGHLPVAEHRRAVVLEEARERVRQRAGSSVRDRPAAPLPAEDDRVGVDPGARRVHRHERLERLPDQERLHMPVLELAPNHVPRRDCVAPQPDTPARVLEQHFLQRRAEPRRRHARASEDPLHLVVLGDEAPVGVGVPRREARDLLPCAFQVEPHRELLLVRERHMADGVGLEITQPVVRVEPELVVREHRTHADNRVPGRAGVDLVARAEQLLRGRAAAGYGACVEDQALVAGLREVRRSDEAVVASPCDHDVSGVRHVVSRRSALPARIAISMSGASPRARTVSTCRASPMSNG